MIKDEQIIDAEIINPSAPIITDSDVITEEDRANDTLAFESLREQESKYMMSSRQYIGKVQPTEETAKFSRKYQVRSKYLGNGKKREQVTS